MLEVLGRPRVAIGLLVSLVVVLVVVNGLDLPLSVPAIERETGHRYLDTCAFCSGDQVLHELVALGERGRLLQALLFCTVDVLIPGLFGLAGAAVVAALTRRGSRWRALCWLPVAAAALDLIENAAIIGLLLGYPEPSPWLAGFAGTISGFKLVAYSAVVVAMVVLGAGRLLRRAPAADATATSRSAGSAARARGHAGSPGR